MSFEDTARRAKAAQQQRDIDARAASEKAAQDRRNEFNVRVGRLEAEVEPVLLKAKAAFGAEGIPSEISANWREGPGTPMEATMYFRCKGPEQRSKHGGVFTPTGVIASFTATDKGVVVKVGKDSFDRHGTTPLPPPQDDHVERAIQRSLESYLKELSEGRS
jgi:hypothetical protein